MGVIVSQSEVLRQSEDVFAQFGDLWVKNATENSKLESFDANNLANCGIGKVLLLCAMGESLEKNIDVIKKYRDRFHILTNDKAFVPLLDHGVKADYVMLCDASVPFRHMEGREADTVGVKLISTVYGNPEWTRAWRGERYFYVNRDSIFSERIFRKIFGDKVRTIPAGSNVSNAMVVFFTGCDNEKNINWSGYQRYLLVGYDYSWRPDGNYYAWANPVPKRHYMKHRTMLDETGAVVFTSNNLLFSAKWLYSYITAFDLPLVNCSGTGILSVRAETLENQLSKIDSNPKIGKNISALFDIAKHAHATFQTAQAAFENAREEIIWQ